jgi:thiol-disulfide isomerase/thioredoxin
VRLGAPVDQTIPNTQQGVAAMMRGRSFRAGAAVLAGLVLAFTALRADDRTAEQILKDLDATKTPRFDQSKQRDQAYIQQYIKEMQEAQKKRGELIKELYKVAPEHERIPQLMSERWMNSSPDEIAGELDDVIAHAKSEKLRNEAGFAKARFALLQNRGDIGKAMPAIEQFVGMAPKDDRAAQLLNAAAQMATDPAVKTKLEDRILKDFPDSRAAKFMAGARRQREGVGKPFDLEFQDAISGKTITSKDLKGKVVVVDFWATWCGPCVAEMPNMKKLYAEYKDKGVEFVGVSLDQPKDEGGLDALKQFVEKNEIGWPQYYQGAGWDSDFSGSWGINSIPAVFVIDAEGNLHSTEARGRLESMIPELLKKRDAGTGAGGQ